MGILDEQEKFLSQNNLCQKIQLMAVIKIIDIGLENVINGPECKGPFLRSRLKIEKNIFINQAVSRRCQKYICPPVKGMKGG